jgi:molecular chaperone GrpE
MFNRKKFSNKMNTKFNQSDTQPVSEDNETRKVNNENTADSNNPSADTETPTSPEEALQPIEENPVQKLETELIEEKDKLIRLFAEFENYKKRTIRERMDLMKNAGQDIIISLLPVLDDFERALKNIDGVENSVKEGLMLIQHKLKTILEQKGLKPIEAIGKPFDTDLHEAISNVPAPEKMKGKIVDEAEKGYFLNGKVIRHSKVIVGN